MCSGRASKPSDLARANLSVLRLQKVIEWLWVRFGDHLTRRPLERVRALGFEITEQERLGPTGVIERLSSVKPAHSAR